MVLPAAAQHQLLFCCACMVMSRRLAASAEAPDAGTRTAGTAAGDDVGDDAEDVVGAGGGAAGPCGAATAVAVGTANRAVAARARAASRLRRGGWVVL
ncbi:hypothetical protein GCM10018785_64610 [Streptomyces longispororuber]|uniref:Secreted protein n=1 Tax=Streptomyces longispororuber TaxID=68230 RepID=A0A919DXM1_9ACTN|nr:hypothetical protein GCM10018785_64610 [Streptomyces longispororuber]